MPAVTPVFNFTKNLTFDNSTDLTNNFTQVIQAGSQNVTGGVVQFRNSTYDKSNHIITNFTVNKIISFLIRHNWWRGGSASQESYNLDCNVLDSNNNIITTFLLSGSYTHSYNDGSPQYYNAGYMFWKLGTDANNTTSKRLCSFPSQAVHSHELIDMGGGYIQYKLDGVNQGSPFYLGNANYKLGGPITFAPLGGWYNNNIYDDLDTFNLTYL